MSSGSDSEEQNFESADEGEDTARKSPVNDETTELEETSPTGQQDDDAAVVAQPDDPEVDEKDSQSQTDQNVDDDNKETTQIKEEADENDHQQGSTDGTDDVVDSPLPQQGVQDEIDSVEAVKDSQIQDVIQPIQSSENNNNNNNQSKILDKKNDASKQEQAQHQPQEQPQQQQQNSGWGWGFSSWISSASDTVAKISKQAHTIGHTVLDTVESSLGVPDPEHLAERNRSSTQDKEESNDSNADPSKDAKGSEDFLFSSAVTLSSMGKQLVSSGIETFEKIGKKTASVITEQEAGITIEKSQPKLSDILREAREKNAESYLEEPEKESITSKPEPDHFNYNRLLEEFQGLAHLEALDVLSKESDFKIQSLLKTRSEESLHDTMEKVKESFSFDSSSETQDNLDFVNILTEHLKGLNLEGIEKRVLQVDESAHLWIKDYQQAHENETSCDSQEIHIEAIRSLAHLTAESIKLFHKAAERLLLASKEVKTDTSKIGIILSKVAATIDDEFSNLGNLYAHCINSTLTEANSDDNQRQITSIYLEAGNSCSYISDALDSMISIIQFTVLQSLI